LVTPVRMGKTCSLAVPIQAEYAAHWLAPWQGPTASVEAATEGEVVTAKTMWVALGETEVAAAEAPGVATVHQVRDDAEKAAMRVAGVA